MRIDPWTPAAAPRNEELVKSIEARRGGTLINLDRMLLWSEPLARGWNTYLRALRQEISLSPFLRELAICVVARLTGAQYEYHHHAPELKKAGRDGCATGDARRPGQRRAEPALRRSAACRDRLRHRQHAPRAGFPTRSSTT